MPHPIPFAENPPTELDPFDVQVALEQLHGLCDSANTVRQVQTRIDQIAKAHKEWIKRTRHLWQDNPATHSS